MIREMGEGSSVVKFEGDVGELWGQMCFSSNAKIGATSSGTKIGSITSFNTGFYRIDSGRRQIGTLLSDMR